MRSWISDNILSLGQYVWHAKQMSIDSKFVGNITNITKEEVIES